MQTEFTPFASLLGGALIGLAGVALMAFYGRIAGISGIAVRLLPPYEDTETAGRYAFIAGIVVAPLAYMVVTGAMPPVAIETALPALAIAGFLVGFGSVWGNGCTSGHGVCGLSRLSVRSLASVVTFMAVAIATVFVSRHLL